jgi:DNA-binding transcriptional ArsR family regulator
MHVHAMNDRHWELHALMASLGHASRFRIALRLLERERSVGELALAIGLSQSCTTRHIQALERAGIVRSRRDGKRVLVGLEFGRAGLPGLIEWLGPAANDPGTGPERLQPPARVAAGRAEVPTARVRRERAKRRPAHAGGPSPAPASATAKEVPQEGPPAGPPASGTHPAPAETGERQPRRSRDSIEDFLL